MISDRKEPGVLYSSILKLRVLVFVGAGSDNVYIASCAEVIIFLGRCFLVDRTTVFATVIYLATQVETDNASGI